MPTSLKKQKFQNQNASTIHPKNGSCCDETPPMLRQAQHERSLNLETAVGREKAVQTIYVHREFLQLVVTLRVMRDC